MEKPYPDNSGFYGYGALREMGLRKSRHSGDWRSKSMFDNKEENFVQPLKGSETVLLRGTNIRGGGGDRQPSTKTGDGEAAEFREPEGGRAPTSHNLAIIRSLGQSLGLPQAVQERRAFEEELASLHQPNAFPEWGLRFIYKIFRTYTTPFPAFSYGLAKSASTMGSPAACSSRSDTSRNSAKKSAASMSTALALKVEIMRGQEMPQMDAVGIDEGEGCDAYVVLRYDGEVGIHVIIFASLSVAHHICVFVCYSVYCAKQSASVEQHTAPNNVNCECLLDQASVRSNLRSCRSASGLRQFQRHILPSGIRLLCFLFHASVRYRPRLVVCILGNLTTRD